MPEYLYPGEFYQIWHDPSNNVIDEADTLEEARAIVAGELASHPNAKREDFTIWYVDLPNIMEPVKDD